MSGSKLVPIGFVAKRTGLAVSAIRFYEEKGLVFPVRAAGGHRHYRRADIRRLSFVMISQKLGFSIAEIRAQLDRLPKNKAPNRRDWARISAHFQAELDEKITLMTRFRNQLDNCIGCGCLSLNACRLYNPDDEVHIHGPGPQLLLHQEDESPARGQ